MTNFETVFICLLIPVAYVVTYIAGKYDILSLWCEMLEEKVNSKKSDRIEPLSKKKHDGLRAKMLDIDEWDGFVSTYKEEDSDGQSNNYMS